MSVDTRPGTTVSVVVCTHNRRQSLLETLESLAATDVPDDATVEFLVVDNASADDTRAAVNEFIARGNGRFRYLHEPGKGKGFALNRGIEEASGEIIAFTDDDAIVDEKWIRATVDAFRRWDADCVGGRIRPLWLGQRPGWLTDDLLNVLAVVDHGDEPYWLGDSQGSHIFLGVNVAIKREFFRRHGLYRTDLSSRGGAGNEDLEMCDRMRKVRTRAVYSPDALVSHKVPPERLTRSYFRRWHYLTGKDLAKVAEDSGLWFLGVPGWRIRYFLRLLKGYVGSWLAFDRNSAFFHELKLIMMLSYFRSVSWRSGGAR